jgi:hypothetical protein
MKNGDTFVTEFLHIPGETLEERKQCFGLAMPTTEGHFSLWGLLSSPF